MVAKLINNVNPNSSLSMLSHASLKPDPPPKRKGGSCKYSTTSHHVAMDKSWKWVQ